MEEKTKFLKKLSEIKHRLTMLRFTDLVTYGFTFSLMLTLIISVLALFVPIYRYKLLNIIIVIFFVIFSVTISLVFRPTLMDAALKSDSLGLNERTITALSLIDSCDEMSVLQRRDAIVHLFTIIPKRDIKGKNKAKYICFSFFCLAASIFLSFVSTPAKVNAETRTEASISANEAEKEIKKELKTLDTALDFTDEELETLNSLIKDANKEMKNAASKESVKRAYERYEKKLANALKSIAESKNESQIADACESCPKFSDALKKTDGSINQTETANAGNMGNSENSGNSGNVGNSNNSGNSNTGNGKNSGNESDGGNSVSGNDESTDRDDESLGGNLNNGSDDSPGGSSDGSTGGSSTGATGNNAGNNGGNSSGTGWNTGSDTGTESNMSLTKETITVPSNFTDTEISGKTDGSSSGEYTEINGSMTFSGTATDYEQVISEYTKKAYTAIDSESVPDALKGIVKNYFSDLSE